jgi:hypothetical protein
MGIKVSMDDFQSHSMLEKTTDSTLEATRDHNHILTKVCILP